MRRGTTTTRRCPPWTPSWRTCEPRRVAGAHLPSAVEIARRSPFPISSLGGGGGLHRCATSRRRRRRRENFVLRVARAPLPLSSPPPPPFLPLARPIPPSDFHISRLRPRRTRSPFHDVLSVSVYRFRRGSTTVTGRLWKSQAAGRR